MLCVIAKLEDRAKDNLMRLRQAVLPNGAVSSPVYGHVTLATYLGEDEDAFVRSCRDILHRLPPFMVEYDQIRVLEETSVLVAVPKENDFLVMIHRSITEQYRDSLDQWTGTDLWYPHTTILFAPEADLQDLYEKMREHFVPFCAAVNRIEFSRVLESGYEIINAVDLISREETREQESDPGGKA